MTSVKKEERYRSVSAIYLTLQMMGKDDTVRNEIVQMMLSKTLAGKRTEEVGTPPEKSMQQGCGKKDAAGRAEVEISIG